MRVALLHNDTAGHEVYETSDLERLFRDAGHEVDCFGTNKKDVRRAVETAPAALVAAGGDGTVAKVAIAVHEAGATTPMYVLPVGTSNNIARSLEIRATVPELARGLSGARLAKLDVGVVKAPWGQEFFIEAAGLGFIGTMLQRDGTLRERLARAGRAVRYAFKPKLTRAERARLGVGRLVRHEPARHCHVTVDGEDLTGEYIAVELMNIREIGPRVRLAPDADTGDQWLDLVLIRADDRTALDDYVRANGDLTRVPPGITRRVRRAEISWPESGGHIDDAPWPGDKHKSKGNVARRVAIEVAGSVSVLLPPAAP